LRVPAPPRRREYGIRRVDVFYRSRDGGDGIRPTEFAQTLEARAFEVGLHARLARYRDTGTARVVVMLPSAKSDTILPTLDRWAKPIRRVG
jgi:hypothetical protein